MYSGRIYTCRPLDILYKAAELKQLYRGFVVSRSCLTAELKQGCYKLNTKLLIENLLYNICIELKKNRLEVYALV